MLGPLITWSACFIVVMDVSSLHRDVRRGSWESGPDDFVPPPDGYV